MRPEDGRNKRSVSVYHSVDLCQHTGYCIIIVGIIIIIIIIIITVVDIRILSCCLSKATEVHSMDIQLNHDF
jgi:uncharacterized integral membrane protein